MTVTTDEEGVRTEAARSATRRRIPPWAWVVIVLGAVFFMACLRVITGVDDITSSGALGAAIALAVPIALAGLGGVWSERSGIINIGLEGMMILGTFGAAYFAYFYGPWVGVLGAIAFGMLGGVIHAVATVIFGVDHIVSGVAINIIGLGTAKYLASRFFSELPGGGPTQSPPLDPLPRLTVPGLSEWLGTVENLEWFFVSDLAALLRALCTDVSVLTIIALGLFVLTSWVLWRSAFGLRLRSCGESPSAAETLGVNVLRYKFMAVTISGGMAGLGGGFLALVAAGIFRDGQTGGRGFIGLAAMIFGNWRPSGVLAGSILFGYTDAIQLRGGGITVHALILGVAALLIGIGMWLLLRHRKMVAGTASLLIGVAVGIWWLLTDSFPGDLAGALPYVTTLLVLAFASQRLRPPAFIGQVYRKGEGS